ncbi:MAG TPA: antibiotic biosynthesis monooxygenase [Burkholderiales bacterium]|nr:antibiotic biosynthesis monooxygenase [Burkholderiales bacterium]
MTFRIAAVLAFLSFNSFAQAPAVPADVSPLYIVTYVEVQPSARDQGAALMKQYRDASRSSAGNLRAVAVQRTRRPGQFVLVSAWQNKAAWDAALPQLQGPRDKLVAIRNAPLDDRFNNSLSVGPMDVPVAAGATFGVTHVDVIPPQKDNALAALKVLGDANRAAPGNLRFEIVQQTNRPNHFTVFEMWRSREAFESNSQSAHQREFRDKLSPMAGALYDERLYEILE